MTTRSLHHRPLRSLTLAALLALLAPGSVAWALTSVQLDPAQIEVGDRATLSLTSDAADAEPSLPAIDGLDLSLRGRQQSLSSVNGVATRSTSWIFTVRGLKPGDYTITPTLGGRRLAEVRLTVTPAGQAPSGGGQGGAPSWGQAPRGRGAGRASRGQAPPSKSGGASSRRPHRAFIRIYTPRDELRLGESAPITLKAYFLAGTGATLTGFPKIDTDAFTVTGLDDKPSQKEAEIRGQRYLVATWTGTITAVKEGEHSLSAELPVQLEWREATGEPAPRPRQRRAPRRRLGALFDDPFFSGGFGGFGGGSLLDDPMIQRMLQGGGFDDDLFAGGLDSFMGGGRSRVRRRSRVLKTERRDPIVVQAPPQEGKPQDYAGAVGRFELHASASPSRVRVGEPVTVTTTVEGEGNFDAVRVELPAGPGYKTYPVTSSFEGRRGSDRRGVKTFEQLVVPTAPGPLTLPAVTLSYWDTKADGYRSLTSEALTVAVNPGAGPGPEVAAVTPKGGASEEGDERGGGGLSGVIAELDEAVAARPWVWPAAGGLLLGLLGLVALRRRRSLGVGASPGASRSALKVAASGGEAPAFFREARRLIAHEAARRLGLDGERLDSSAGLRILDTRLPELPGDVVTIFEAADRLTVLPKSSPPWPRADWLRRTEAALDDLRDLA